MNRAAIQKAFEEHLKKAGLKLTPQRGRIFDRAFDTHDHFSAEQLYEWLKAEDGEGASRATVYRTLGMLTEGGFLESLDAGKGELLYEHVLGHSHHDHMVCTSCGRIEEFHEPRIEELQEATAERLGFRLTSHSMRLFGVCPSCDRGANRSGKGE